MTHLANYFIARYGLKDVQQWNFETWNEPDHQHHFFTDHRCPELDLKIKIDLPKNYK